MHYRRVVPLLRQPSVWRCYSSRRTDEEVMNVFDRKAKRRQKNRAALAENVGVYDYLKDEVRITVVMCTQKELPSYACMQDWTMLKHRKTKLNRPLPRAVNTRRLQILRSDREGIIDDVTAHGVICVKNTRWLHRHEFAITQNAQKRMLITL